MRIQCPNCHHGLEIVPDVPSKEVRCPSCGSQLDLSSTAETATYRAESRRTIGHFELLEQVGRGHFGNVWRARDTRLKRIVAVKIPRTADLSNADKEFFLREAQTAAKLRHPNIVTVHEVGHDGDAIFIVSDFIPGITLAEQIHVRPPTCQEAAEWCATVADALDYAHENGVIHRDMKPGNVMLEKDKPYVLDFGLAKHEASDFTITSEGEILGTPAYMSPEQARGDSGSADRRSDVYSLGTVLYELITGRKPFQGGTRALMHQILNDEPTPPRKINKKIPRDLETICLRAMAKDANQRYLTAKEMAEDLRRFLAGEPIHARPVRWYERSWRWAKRNPMGVIAATCALCLVLLGTFTLARGFGNPELGVPSVKVSIKILVREMLTVKILAPVADEEKDEVHAKNAEVVFWPLSPADGEPVFDKVVRKSGKSPLLVDLTPGEYLVVANIPGHGFHEVYRQVPADQRWHGSFRHNSGSVDKKGTILLPAIDVPPLAVTKKMARFTGAKDFTIGSNENATIPPHQRNIPPFFLASTEFSYAQHQLQNPNFKMGALDPRYPVVEFNYDRALHELELAGMRLPDEFEYEFAATMGGIRRFPWGNDPKVIADWVFGRAGSPPYDRVDVEPAVFGLFSNVAEWTCSPGTYYPAHLKLIPNPPTATMERIVRGGSRSVIQGQPKAADYLAGPRIRIGVPRRESGAKLGFRGARSEKPRMQQADFGAVIATGTP